MKTVLKKKKEEVLGILDIKAYNKLIGILQCKNWHMSQQNRWRSQKDTVPLYMATWKLEMAYQIHDQRMYSLINVQETQLTKYFIYI